MPEPLCASCGASLESGTPVFQLTERSVIGWCDCCKPGFDRIADMLDVSLTPAGWRKRQTEVIRILRDRGPGRVVRNSR